MLELPQTGGQQRPLVPFLLLGGRIHWFDLLPLDDDDVVCWCFDGGVQQMSLGWWSATNNNPFSLPSTTHKLWRLQRSSWLVRFFKCVAGFFLVGRECSSGCTGKMVIRWEAATWGSHQQESVVMVNDTESWKGAGMSWRFLRPGSRDCTTE